MENAQNDKPQGDRFREAGVDVTKEDFARVIGGPAKPQTSAKEVDKDQAADQ